MATTTTTTPLINRSHSGEPYSWVNLHGANIIMIIARPHRNGHIGCYGHIFVYFDSCDAKNCSRKFVSSLLFFILYFANVCFLPSFILHFLFFFLPSMVYSPFPPLPNHFY